jgi:ribosome-associated translation inhibitor RaiA
MDILFEKNVDRAIPRAHASARLRRVLRRLPAGPVTAHVSFADVNGPKGGDDVRCALRIDLPHQPPIVAEGAGDTPHRAFDAAFDRITRRVQAQHERWQDSRRHPKKYYAASRLL